MMSLASIDSKISVRQPRGSTRQESGCDQGMWTKKWRNASGRAARISDGASVEVVVVEHHERLGVALDHAEDRLGDVGVDDLVAVVPGLDLLDPDVGRVGEVPEIVLK